jgi:hypothetical protein
VEDLVDAAAEELGDALARGTRQPGEKRTPWDALSEFLEIGLAREGGVDEERVHTPDTEGELGLGAAGRDTDGMGSRVEGLNEQGGRRIRGIGDENEVHRGFMIAEPEEPGSVVKDRRNRSREGWRVARTVAMMLVRTRRSGHAPQPLEGDACPQ